MKRYAVFLAVVIALVCVTALITAFSFQKTAAAPPAKCVNETGTGGCYSSIQEAITHSIAGGKVIIYPGTYTEHITMTQGVSVIGSGSANTTIKSNNADDQPIVKFNPGIDSSTVLSGVKILGVGTTITTNGVSGGGINIINASPRILNVTVDNCYAQFGGGINVYQGAPYFEGIDVINNHGQYGGGFYISNNATVTITVSDIALSNNISANNADEGGGIYLSGSSLIMSDTLLNANSADQIGGGVMAAQNSIVKLHDNTFWSNSANNGGGVFLTNVNNALHIWDNTFRSNNAADSGGGLFINLSSGKIENNWLTSNSAINSEGGGIYVSSDCTNLLIKDNLMTENTATSNAGGAISVQSNSSATIDSNHIYFNRAYIGGGVAIYSTSVVTLTNNIIAYNVATIDPSSGPIGGVLFSGTPSVLINNTIADNTGSGFVFSHAEGCVIRNNIFSGNSQWGILNFLTSSYQASDLDAYSNTSGNYSSVSGTNLYTYDPNYINTTPFDIEAYHLNKTSTINTLGGTTFAPRFDIDNQLRGTFGTTSIGADENVNQLFIPFVSK